MQLANDALLNEEIKAKILADSNVFEHLPAVVIIHNLRNGSVVYLSKKGLDLLGVAIEDIRAMPHDEYHRRFFNPADAIDYVPRLLDLLERNNDDEMISHFQQVRFKGRDDWSWHLSSIKIYHRDEDGKPLLAVALAIPIDAMHHMTVKAARLLEENNFLRENLSIFSRLTRREKEILGRTAAGKSSVEIADELFISVTTVETHRRNLKGKLNVNTWFELSQYARAFDLI